MSEILKCENSIEEAEDFIALLAQESAAHVTQQVPKEYRGAYITGYLATLAVRWS